MVSQSSVGTMTGKITMPGGKDISIDDATFVEKIDIDVFNMRSDVNMTVMGAVTQVRVIFNADTKAGVVFQKATMGATVMQNCTKYDYSKVPGFPSVEQMQAIFKQFLPVIQQAAKCGGNDGTLDTWNVHYDQTVPVPGNGSVAVSVDGTIKMDNSSLMSSANTKISVVVGSTNVDESIDMETTAPTTAGGPKAADMDYSDKSVWGECKEGKIPTPPTMTKLFEPVDSTDVSLVIDKVINMQPFPKALLAMIQTNQGPQKEVVV